jgi:hypothetical protein
LEIDGGAGSTILKEIGPRAFENKSAITGILIPRSIVRIGENAFYGCTGLTAIYYAGTLAQWATVTKAEPNVTLSVTKVYCYSEAETTDGNHWHWGEDGIPAVWPKGKPVEPPPPNNFVGFDTYDYEDKLVLERYTGADTLVIVPTTIGILDEAAFTGNAVITDVVLPLGLSWIVTGAFAGCESLQNIYFRGTAQQWGYIEKPLDEPFVNAEKYWYSEARNDGGSYWRWKNGVPTVWVEGDDDEEGGDDDPKEEFEMQGTTLVKYNGDAAHLLVWQSEIDIKTIDKEAFAGNVTLRSIVIPKSVTKIDDNPFEGCDNLQYIYFAHDEAELFETLEVYAQMEDLLVTKCYFYSETSKPRGDYWGYWHYAGGAPEIW